MNAVISVIGKDTVGILARVSAECATNDVNIVDVSQTVLNSFFAMIMVVNIDKVNIPFVDFVDKMSLIGKSQNLEINVMHEDIFNSMHKI